MLVVVPLASAVHAADCAGTGPPSETRSILAAGDGRTCRRDCRFPARPAAVECDDRILFKRRPREPDFAAAVGNAAMQASDSRL